MPLSRSGEDPWGPRGGAKGSYMTRGPLVESAALRLTRSAAVGGRSGRGSGLEVLELGRLGEADAWLRLARRHRWTWRLGGGGARRGEQQQTQRHRHHF